MVQSTQIDNPSLHKTFQESTKPHVLMITNHGIHQWQIIPGLPDTGGQNVFVNFFSDALVRAGYRVSTVNRGGFAHPSTGEQMSGISYKNENSRIVYLEDGKNEFVRKEDMHEQIPALVEDLKNFLETEHCPVELILSHYWDAAQIGIELSRSLPTKVKHVWTPHSLGTVKKANMDESTWAGLRIDERIETEKTLIEHLDAVAATSSVIRDALNEHYGAPPQAFLPPCVDTERYSPGQLPSDSPVWSLLAENSGASVEEIQNSTIITEISRTDQTKRKNVLIEAFAKITEQGSDAFLALTIDQNQKELFDTLSARIEELGIRNKVAILGSIWEILPQLYQATDIYCTPSVMEGFGMSIQEAAATSVPAVSSNLVPFAVEYLLGTEVKKDGALQYGEGAIVVEADNVDGFASALKTLVDDKDIREKMGQRALDITVPYFTWDHMVTSFLSEI